MQIYKLNFLTVCDSTITHPSLTEIRISPQDIVDAISAKKLCYLIKLLKHSQRGG